ncbi:MAG: polysulfide reductase NrfD [Chloroflexi bacterium]|nr:polysulfide reductase NrfD [Chloroflexota bacterium]
MRYGFVIDQRRCIGCHACTVACKSENDVPLGVFRTWVKYVEKGRYPNTRRHFLVQRCNHCDNAPCVKICPTKALFKRPDGIIDFDNRRCIGCKSCMEACPYDALYIDPVTDTAAKCNYCAHRTEIGLQPACVLVCPEEAIIAGDIDDPTSRISQLLGREDVRVRRPDQGTQPKLWYIGAEESAITPETYVDPQGGMWSQHHEEPVESLIAMARNQPSAAPRTARVIASDAAAPSGSLPAASVAASILAGAATGQVDYNVAHEQPWGRLVSLYLWTKSISAGAFLLATLALGFSLTTGHSTFGILAPVLSLFFLLVTTALLVGDLRHPERFLYILVKPNLTSWLVKGAYVLILFGGLVTVWLAASLLRLDAVTRALIWPAALFALAAAGYSAFLFGQAEGRDFWQSPLLLPHLLAQAFVAGAATLSLAAAATGAPMATWHLLVGTLLLGLTVHVLLLLGELAVPHSNAHVRLAAEQLVHGGLRRPFWGLVVIVGIVLAGIFGVLALAGAATPVLSVLAGICALVGLLIYEDVWITAGQSVPLS